MHIENVHERVLGGSLAEGGRLIDGLSSPCDCVWPHDHWPPMVLDRPLAVDARGGHGPVRYTVCEYVPGSRVAFRFDAAGLTTGFDGFHALALLERGGEVVLRHELVAECTVSAWLRWVLGVRVLHDALVEDALDRAAAATGGSPTAAPWSASVRLLRRVAAQATS